MTQRNFEFLLILAAPCGPTPAPPLVTSGACICSEAPDRETSGRAAMRWCINMWCVRSHPSTDFINNNDVQTAVCSLMISFAATGHLKSSEETESVWFSVLKSSSSSLYRSNLWDSWSSLIHNSTRRPKASVFDSLRNTKHPHLIK